jgi:hypothetical protein
MDLDQTIVEVSAKNQELRRCLELVRQKLCDECCGKKRHELMCVEATRVLKETEG